MKQEISTKSKLQVARLWTGFHFEGYILQKEQDQGG